MRGFFLLIFVVGALRALDTLAFNGRYSETALQEAQSQGRQFQYEVRQWINKAMSAH